MKNDGESLSSSELKEAYVLADPQDVSDKIRAAQSINGCAAAVYDAWNNAAGLCRQAEVITHGIVEGGTKEFGNEIAKRPLETGINGGLALGLGLGLSYLHLRHKLAHKVVGAIAGLFGVKAAIDGFKHLSENRDFTSAMDLAWGHDDKKTMDRSKALAVKVLAPEVVQLEVGALAGGVGYSGGLAFAALKNKTFAQPWSQLIAKAAECVHKKGANKQIIQQTETIEKSIGKSLPVVACDEFGRALDKATPTEQYVISEFLERAQNRFPDLKLQARLAYKKTETDEGKILVLVLDNRGINHDALGHTGMALDTIAEELAQQHGVPLKLGYDGVVRENTRPIDLEFVDAKHQWPHKWTALIDHSELLFCRQEEMGIPEIRPNDVERIVLGGLIGRIQSELPSVKILAARRTVGPASGRTVEPLILEIAEDNYSSEILQKLALAAEEMYKLFRCRVGICFARNGAKQVYGDGSVPIYIKHLVKATANKDYE